MRTRSCSSSARGPCSTSRISWTRFSRSPTPSKCSRRFPSRNSSSSGISRTRRARSRPRGSSARSPGTSRSATTRSTPPSGPPLRTAFGADEAVYVTGSAPAAVDSELTLEGGGDFIVTILLVVILIGLYFRSVFSPAFPILTIAIAILIGNLFVYFVAVYLFSIDFTVTAVLQTVLLAAGTDYSIFLVSRYRDERRDGKDREEAVRNAVIWAGESVTTSGGAVLIAFFALSLGSFPIVKGMGIYIGFALTVPLGIALTFIPSALPLPGNRLFGPSGKRFAKPRTQGELTVTERYFRNAALFSMKHAKAVLLVALLITIPATYIVLTDLPTYDLTEGAPVTESGQGLEAIGAAFGYGFVYPAYVVVRFPGPVLLADGNVSVARMDTLHNLSRDMIAREPGVKSVEGPTNPQGSDVNSRNLSSAPDPGPPDHGDRRDPGPVHGPPVRSRLRPHPGPSNPHNPPEHRVDTRPHDRPVPLLEGPRRDLRPAPVSLRDGDGAWDGL